MAYTRAVRGTAGPQVSGAVLGRYVLVEALSQGVDHQLWLAIDVDLDRKVALELPQTIDRKTWERVLAKVSVVAGLAHPNVAVIHDTGEIDGQLYIAREYVDGEALEAWLARAPYPWQEALVVMQQVGAGLAAAHAGELVHGGLEPSKIILGRDGRVRVLDFGLRSLVMATAAELSHEPGGLELDREIDGRILRARPRREFDSGPQLGRSPAYLAPEQLRAEASDERTDVFSFCVLLFEALYGQRPYEGATQRALLRAIESGAWVEIPGEEQAPAWIHRVVMRGLAAAPLERHADMLALLGQLELSPPQRRRRRMWGAGVLAAGLGLSALGLSVRDSRVDPCGGDDDRLAREWGPERSASLRGRLESLVPSAERAADVLLEGIDTHALAWARAERQLCRDELAKRSTPRLQQARARCLELERVALGALTELGMTGADLRVVDALARRPHAALRSLGEPAACLEARAPERLGPALEAEVGEREQALARGRLILALSPEDVGQLAREALRGVGEGHGDEAAFELLRGRAAASLRETKVASAHLDRAAQLSVLTDPSLAAQAWLELAQLGLAELVELEHSKPGSGEGRQLRREVALSLDYAEAMLELDALALQVQLAVLRVELALEGADPVRAHRALEIVMPLAEAGARDAPDLLARLLEARAALHELEGDPAGGALDRERAHSLQGG